MMKYKITIQQDAFQPCEYTLEQTGTHVGFVRKHIGNLVEHHIDLLGYPGETEVTLKIERLE